MDGELQQWAEKPVTQSDLECAATNICRVTETMKGYPELVDRIKNIKRLLAEAAEAFAGGEQDKCNKIFSSLKKERASLFYTQSEKP